MATTAHTAAMTNYVDRPAAGFAPRFTPKTPLQLRLHGSLWSWRAQGWSGYVDFREPGVCSAPHVR